MTRLRTLTAHPKRRWRLERMRQGPGRGGKDDPTNTLDLLAQDLHMAAPRSCCGARDAPAAGAGAAAASPFPVQDEALEALDDRGRSNACFHHLAPVLMANGSFKRVEELCAGDEVAPSEAGASPPRVLCVVKTDCLDGKAQMVRLNSNLLITPWHPVRRGTEWVFPADVAAPEETACAQVCSVVLDGGHSLEVGGVVCVTLGHGLVSNPVTNHPYFATERVLRDLERMPGFASGLLHFRHGSVRRGQDGRVIGFDASLLRSAGDVQHIVNAQSHLGRAKQKVDELDAVLQHALSERAGAGAPGDDEEKRALGQQVAALQDQVAYYRQLERESAREGESEREYLPSDMRFSSPLLPLILPAPFGTAKHPAPGAGRGRRKQGAGERRG